MLIETRYLKFFVLITLATGAYSAKSQDSVHVTPFERYWTKPRIVPKIGFGTQSTAFIEAGVQLHQIYVHPLALASAGPYFTVDALIKKNNPIDDFIIGPKIGYEVTGGLFGLAADFTYYTDFSRESVMFTPKAGLTILGFADLFYGYNLSLSSDTFKSISKNRFSLVFNINKDYFNLRAAGRKPEKHHQ
jgi:hypothetical protein